MSFCTSFSVNLRPIRRFTAYSVLRGLVTAWRLAEAPTRISPSSWYAMIDGVVRAPSLFSMTRVVAFHDGHARIRGAEVDADDLSHVVLLKICGLAGE
jgi:hypothetical protein